MGNMLDTPHAGDWSVRLDDAYIDKAAGAFTTVRLPVRWSNHAAPTADATLDEAFAARVDRAVNALLAKGVYVILDMHHYSQLSGGKLHRNEFAVDPAVLETRLVNMWRQIAVRDLPKLRLPPDRNLIVAIHNCDPFDFTHQGVTSLPKSFPTRTTGCDAAQRKAVTDPLDAARRWSQENGYPLHLGEFGAYSAADRESRETYTRLVRDEAERRGIGWTYWEFASSFGVYSREAGTWVEPIRRALLD